MKNSFDLLGDLGEDNQLTPAAKKKEALKKKEAAKAEKLAQEKLAAKAAAKKKKEEEAAKKKKDAEELAAQQSAARMAVLDEVLKEHQFKTKQGGLTYVRDLDTTITWNKHIIRGHLTIDKAQLTDTADQYIEPQATLAAVPYHVTWAEGDDIFDKNNARWRTSTKKWDLPKESQIGLGAREESAQLVAEAATVMDGFAS